MTTTTDPLDALLFLRDGQVTARWNFADAVGSSLSAPGGLGNAVSLSYSFLSAAPSYFVTTGFASFSTAARDATREVLDMVSEVARVAFNEVSGVGTMTFGMNAQSGSAGFAYIPSYGYSYSNDTIVSVTAQPEAGDVWLNSNQGWTAADFEAGGSGFGTLVHEIGHALGLKHPFEADSPGGYTLDPSLDNKAWTVMSYTEHPHGLFRTVTDNGGGSYSWQYEYIQPETMMPYDIVALQYLYGANTTTRAGNDSYTFDPARPFIKTITDAGGIDTISVANFSKGSVIDLRDGHFSSIRIPSDTLPPGVTETNTDIYDGTDNLAIAFGVVIENATGGSGADRLTGNAVANRLDGGAGNDTMTGGAGNDSYVVGSSGDVVSETSTLATEVDSVISGVSWTLGSYLERLTLSGSSALNGTGNALANLLTGNTGANSLSGADGNDSLLGGDGIDTLLGGNGNDSLDGGAGNDSLTGGAGNDVYVVQSSADKTIEASGGGTADSVSASLAWTLAAEVEHLTLTGTGVINGTGNALANRLTGNAAANVLDGGTGNDTMTGGDGSDTYYLAQSGDSISETNASASSGGTDLVCSWLSACTLGTNIENGQIKTTGTASLTGNALNNVLFAGAGNNVLDGGTGSDTVDYRYAGTAVTVSLVPTTGQATGGSGTDTLLGIESLIGSALADRLTGSSVANTLNGGAGADTLTGGDGSDNYYLDHSGDLVVESNATASTGGTDTVYSSLASYTLGSNVENGRVNTTATASITGNSLNNAIRAGAGNNTLNGGSGTDAVDYGTAASAVTVSLATTAAQATGGSGSDTLSSFENLLGSAYNDTLTGSSGANDLTGGAGSDRLIGGAGADRFFLNSPSGSDTLTDFVSASDKIVVSQAAIRVGDGDTTVEGAVTKSGPGGFATSAEWVVVTGNISGSITTTNAAAKIGSATSAYVVGAKALFMVDNGAASALYLFSSAGADAVVSSTELSLLATLSATAATVTTDLLFGA
jgi:Ca2+-binding RTX toxin-like protein